MKTFTFTCHECGEQFDAYSNVAKYCGIVCRQRRQLKRQRENNKRKHDGTNKQRINGTVIKR